ncbi:DinB family protein [Sinomicrobium sp. M5D2P9]
MKTELLMQFDLHHRLFNNVLEDLTDEETNTRINGNTKMNHIKYIAGHLMSAQYGFAYLAGLHPEEKWNALFSPTSGSRAMDNMTYPDISEIVYEWNRLYKDIRRGLEQVPNDILHHLPPPPMNGIIGDTTLSTIFENTIAGLWAFFNHHQAYHIGQIGILRRGLGKSAMRYDEPKVYNTENK